MGCSQTCKIVSTAVYLSWPFHEHFFDLNNATANARSSSSSIAAFFSAIFAMDNRRSQLK